MTMKYDDCMMIVSFFVVRPENFLRGYFLTKNILCAVFLLQKSLILEILSMQMFLEFLELDFSHYCE